MNALTELRLMFPEWTEEQITQNALVAYYKRAFASTFKVSPKAQKVVDLVAQHIDPPTIANLAEQLSMGYQSVLMYVRSMERANVLERVAVLINDKSVTAYKLTEGYKAASIDRKSLAD